MTTELTADEACQMICGLEFEQCRRRGLWRPANIPMMQNEWFCKQHAVDIAVREGMYGVYSKKKPDMVEELPAWAGVT